MFINDLAVLLRFAKIVVFADNAKIFMPINSPLDFRKVQRDIDTVASRGEANGIRLNIAKSNTVTSTRAKNLTIYQYLLITSRLVEKTELETLVSLILNLTLKTILIKFAQVLCGSLGLTKKVTYDSRDCNSIINLYRTLIIPKLVYALTVWSPQPLLLIPIGG